MRSILRVIAPLALLMVGCGAPTEQSASPSLIATRTESPLASQLSALDMPGSRSSQAGDDGCGFRLTFILPAHWDSG